MQASDYLKMKFQSDRQLAIYGQQGVAGTWYSSCLIPSYHDVCDELLSEEKRMYLSILSLYRYRDVIAHMLYLYFGSVISDSENGNEHNRVRKTDSKVTGLVKALQLIGTEQKCALAARRLKTLNPKYYATLYAAQLEMLYYFFEPFLSELIKKVQLGFYKDFDAIYKDLKGKEHV